MGGVFGYPTLIPIIFGGMFMAWSVSRMSNIRVRVFAQFIVVVLQILIFGILFPWGGGALMLFAPDPLPYLFFWSPVVAQLVYINQNSAPKPWIAALIGLLAVVAGFLLLFMIPQY